MTPCYCGPADSPRCECGHTQHWHGAAGCEHDASCQCSAFSLDPLAVFEEIADEFHVMEVAARYSRPDSA